MLFNRILGLGRPYRSLANRFVNEHRSLAHWKSNLDFLQDCIDHKLVPKGFRLRMRPQSREEGRWKKWAEEKRVIAACKAARRHFYQCRQSLDDILNNLVADFPADLRHGLIQTAQHAYRVSLQDYISTKDRKLSSLLMEDPLLFYSKQPKAPEQSLQTVINLSQKPMPFEERAVLSLGTKFAVPVKSTPAVSMAVRCQYAAELATKKAEQLGVPGEDIAAFKNNAAHLLTSSTRSKLPRLSPTLQRGLSSIQNDLTRVVVCADKAKAVVVMDRMDYEQTTLRSLGPPLYSELPSDPSDQYNSHFLEKLLSSFAGPPRRGVRRDRNLQTTNPDKYKLYLSLRSSHGRCGAYYVQVKTHKYEGPPRTEDERLEWIRDLKVRPINPGYRMIDHELCKHITLCLQQVPRPPLSIVSGLEALDRLHMHDHQASSCRLLSLDVIGMFPSIPVHRALPLLLRLLKHHSDKLAEVTCLSPEQIVDLLGLSISNTYCVVTVAGQERFFRQESGLAMGKSYSPVVADLYMGLWEESLSLCMEREGGEVLFAMRYADDYLVGIRGSDDCINQWLTAINLLDDSIQLELELERDASISFLDLAIKRTDTGFQTSVFRKPCSTNQVVPFGSFCDQRYLRSAISSEVTRAIRYCSVPRERGMEFQFIWSKFKAYGYPSTLISASVASAVQAAELRARALSAPPDPNSVPVIRIPFPYTGTDFYAFKRLANKIGITLVAKSVSTLSNLLCSRTKQKLPKSQDSGVVYGIRCGCGGVYIGETERELQTRLEEHERGKRTQSRASAFGDHPGCQTNFNPDADNVLVLAREPHHRLRLLTESAFIRTLGGRETILVSPNDSNINRNSGTLLDDRWLPCLWNLRL